MANNRVDDDDRRAFLLRLARTAAYAAPVIYTLGAPKFAQAQGLSGKMMGMGMGAAVSTEKPDFIPERPSAPWAKGPGSDAE